jgi:hypothetical protein
MHDRNRGRRIAAALLASLAAVGVAAILATSAMAGGVTREQLESHGWTCFVPPPRPDLVECFDPGRGRPFPGNPDPRASYDFLGFSLSGEFLFTGHLIRADLYAGQRCGTSPYVFLPPIGYYYCEHA